MTLIQIVLNVLGGLVTVGVIELGRFARRLWHLGRFRAVFGDDVLHGTSYYLVHTSFVLDEAIVPIDEHGNKRVYLYHKQGQTNGRFSISEPVSGCEIRATKYIQLSPNQ